MASLLPITIVDVSTNFAPFSTFFRLCEKQKVLWISEITQHFQKYFTDYGRGTWALQRMCEAIGVSSQLSFPFPDEKWVAWKSENIECLWHYVTEFLHCFFVVSPYV